jgi:rhodanese-related sulfurtransferase
MPLQKTFEDICADAKTRIREITPDEVASRLRNSQPLSSDGGLSEAPVDLALADTANAPTGASGAWVLIDVRENDEFRAGHLPGARGIGRGVLEYHIADEVPATDTEIVLYCRGGNRSALAADSLQRMGYTNVFSMSGGYREWREDATRPVAHDGEPINH